MDLPVLPGAHPGRPDKHGDDGRLLERGREGVLPPFTRHHVPLVEPDSQAEFPERRRDGRDGLPVDAVVGQEGLVHDPTELRPREMMSDRKKPVAATEEYSRETIPGPLPRPGQHWEERAAPRLFGVRLFGVQTLWTLWGLFGVRPILDSWTLWGQTDWTLWGQTDLEFSPLRPRARSSARRSRLAFDSLWSRAANRADRLGTLSGRERPRIGTSSARVASVRGRLGVGRLGVRPSFKLT